MQRKNVENTIKIGRFSIYVAQKKGGCIRKARGKTIGSAFSPQYYGPNFQKSTVKVHEIYASWIPGKKYRKIIIQFHGKFTSLKSEKCDKTENLQLNQTPSIIQSIEINQISILLR